MADVSIHIKYAHGKKYREVFLYSYLALRNGKWYVVAVLNASLLDNHCL